MRSSCDFQQNNTAEFFQTNFKCQGKKYKNVWKFNKISVFL